MEERSIAGGWSSCFVDGKKQFGSEETFVKALFYWKHRGEQCDYSVSGTSTGKWRLFHESWIDTNVKRKWKPKHSALFVVLQAEIYNTDYINSSVSIRGLTSDSLPLSHQWKPTKSLFAFVTFERRNNTFFLLQVKTFNNKQLHALLLNLIHGHSLAWSGLTSR